MSSTETDTKGEQGKEQDKKDEPRRKINDPTDDSLYKGLSLRTFLKYSAPQMVEQSKTIQEQEKEYVVETKDSVWEEARQLKKDKVAKRRAADKLKKTKGNRGSKKNQKN